MKHVKANKTVVALTLSTKGNNAVFSRERKPNPLPLGRREDMMGTKEGSARETLQSYAFIAIIWTNDKPTRGCSI